MEETREKRAEIRALNPDHTEAQARILFFNLDYAVLGAEEDLRKAARAYDDARSRVRHRISSGCGLTEEQVEEEDRKARVRWRDALAAYREARAALLRPYEDYPDAICWAEKVGTGAKGYAIDYSVRAAGTVEATSEEQAKEKFHGLFAPSDLAERANTYELVGDVEVREEEEQPVATA